MAVSKDGPQYRFVIPGSSQRTLQPACRDTAEPGEASDVGFAASRQRVRCERDPIGQCGTLVGTRLHLPPGLSNVLTPLREKENQLSAFVKGSAVPSYQSRTS